MTAFRFACTVAIATLAIAVSGQQVFAQASGQYYGYGSPQGVTASPQGNNGSGCHVEKWGCDVSVCPPFGPSCQMACQQIQAQIPPLETPSCQNACPIVNELPPNAPTTITIWRNHYVPIHIENRPTPVQPVNIVVKWREIHYLCDCPPGSSQCPHIPGGNAQTGGATPQASAASAPSVPVATIEKAPAKRWIYLAKQGVYGFGYQRQDGLWVIDPGSKRPTPPTEESTAPAEATATVASSTGS